MGRGYVRHVRRKKSLAVINPPQKKRVPHCLLCWIHGWTKNMAEKKGLQKRRLGSLQTKKRLKFIIRKQQKSQETKKSGWFVFGCSQCLKKHFETNVLKKMRPKKKGVFEAWKFTGLVWFPLYQYTSKSIPKSLIPWSHHHSTISTPDQESTKTWTWATFLVEDLVIGIPNRPNLFFFLILREMGQDNIHRLGDVRFLGKRYETYHHCDN